MPEFIVCTACGQEFPATAEYFPTNKVNGKHYLRRICRSCWRANRREYQASPHGKELKRQSRKRRDPQKVAAEKKRSHERNRENDLARSKKHHDAHIEHYRAKSREGYYKNREQRIASAGLHTERRLARLRGLPATLTDEQWIHALEYFDLRCCICGRDPNDEITLAYEHWIPVTAPHCPGTIATNIVPMCHGQRGCNNSKHNRDPHDWLISRYGDEVGDEIEGRVLAYFSSL